MKRFGLFCAVVSSSMLLASANAEEIVRGACRVNASKLGLFSSVYSTDVGPKSPNIGGLSVEKPLENKEI